MERLGGFPSKNSINTKPHIMTLYFNVLPINGEEMATTNEDWDLKREILLKIDECEGPSQGFLPFENVSPKDFKNSIDYLVTNQCLMKNALKTMSGMLSLSYDDSKLPKKGKDFVFMTKNSKIWNVIKSMSEVTGKTISTEFIEEIYPKIINTIIEIEIKKEVPINV